MNSCQKLSELYSDYVERSLHEEVRHEVEIHLKACPPCQQTVDRLGKLRHNLKSLPQLKTSPDFETVLRTRMRLERHRVRPWSFSLPFVPARTLGFAMVLFLAGASVFTYWRLTSQVPTAAQPTSSSFTALGQTANPASASLQPTPYERYVYAIDRFTIPQTPGEKLRISSVGIEKYQAAQADSSATETAQAGSEPVLISF